MIITVFLIVLIFLVNLHVAAMYSIKSVCVINNTIFGVSGADNAFDFNIGDGGGQKKWRINVMDANKLATNYKNIVYKPAAVIGWFSCEGNLHHFWTETFSQVAQSVMFDDTLRRLNDTQIIILTRNKPNLDESKQFGDTTNNDSCHNKRYTTFFLSLRSFIAPSIEFVTAYVDMPPLYSFYNYKTNKAEKASDKPHDTVYCYDYAVVQGVSKPLSDNFVQLGKITHIDEVANKVVSWAWSKNNTMSSNDDNKLNVVIVQRDESRLIINIDELKKSLGKFDSVGCVVIAHFNDSMSIQKQVETVANADVLLGVHGAALEYKNFLGMKRPRGPIAIIEIGWKGWGSRNYYKHHNEDVLYFFHVIDNNKYVVPPSRQQVAKFSNIDEYTKNPAKYQNYMVNPATLSDIFNKISHRIGQASVQIKKTPS